VARPISAGVAVLLYVDLRMRREGLDLVLQTAAGSGSPPTGDEFASLWRPGAGAAPTVAAPRPGPDAGPGQGSWPGPGPDAGTGQGAPPGPGAPPAGGPPAW
jgi:hypothetical protein